MEELEFREFKLKYPFRDLTRINDIGNAIIYKVSPTVAVKEIDRDDEFADSEIKIHRFLSKIIGENVITKFYDSCVTPKNVYIAMEYCKFGSLYNFMVDFSEDGFQHLSFNDFAEILIEMLRCIDCLHKNNVVHRDIKPDNYLISDEGVIKLCDFGFACKADNIEKVYCGTIDYIAPEIINYHRFLKVGESFAGKPADVWAFGISAYELAYGQTPWDEKGICSIDEVMKEIRNLGIKKNGPAYFELPQTPRTIASLDLLLQNCLAIDASHRPTIREMLENKPHFLLHCNTNAFTFIRKIFLND